MNYLDRITVEPGKRGGKPCVRGMRITVSDILEYLASGMSEAQILEDFPDLEADDIRACLAFAAERERRLMADHLREAAPRREPASQPLSDVSGAVSRHHACSRRRPDVESRRTGVGVRPNRGLHARLEGLGLQPAQLPPWRSSEGSVGAPGELLDYGNLRSVDRERRCGRGVHRF